MAIAQLLPKALAAVVPPTKESPANTRVSASFDLSFQTLNDHDLIELKRRAIAFGTDMMTNENPRWLSLLGNSGTGKTLIARLLYRVYKNKFQDHVNRERTERSGGRHEYRYRCGFLNWGEAVNHRFMKGEFAFLEDLREFDFFALDDIASEHEKHRELSASKLYDVLEARLGKWTILTANLSLEQLGRTLDPRIASRMIRGGSEVIDLEMVDFNLRPNHNEKRSRTGERLFS